MNAPDTNTPVTPISPKAPSSSKSYLLPLVLVFGLLLGAATWFLLRPVETDLNSTSTAKEGNAVDSVVIGIKSAPLGFYGQDSVEYESPTFNFNSNIFEGLTTFTKDLKFASRQLVESWTNPSDTQWRLKLRKGVMFHNGEEFTAEDAKYSIDFGKDYVVGDDLAQVKSVTVEDNYTILVETNGPSPLLLNNLINVFVLDKSEVEKNGFDKPVGTGPYKYVSNTDTNYSLIANEDYYLGAPKIKNVTYRVIEEDDQRVDALLSGDVDLIEDVPANRRTDVEANTTVKLKGVPSLRVIYLGMDVSKAKTKYSTASSNPLKNLKVRQAMYMSIDENAIIRDVMGGHAYVATQPSTSVNFGFNPNLKRPTYDPEAAKVLLTEAGYPNGFDIVLDVPNNRYQNDEAIGKAVVADLNKVGIRATLNAQPKEDFFPKILDNYDTSFYLLGWSQENGDAGGAYGTLIHTPDEDAGYGSFNIGGYSNKVVDQLIEQSDNKVDSVERLRILQNLAETAMTDVPIIPLHQQEDSFAVSNKFNWTPRRDNGIRAFEISGN